MRKSTFSVAERLAIVSEQAEGKSVEQICRDHQISPATFYKWKEQQQTEVDENKRRLDVLEKENKLLKKMYSELSIDHLRKAPKRPKIRREFLGLISPNGINEGWAVDFLSEWVIGLQEQSARVISVVDECSRRALWTEAHHNITGKTLTDILDKVIAWRGRPAYICCDNGPEFIEQRPHSSIKYLTPIQFEEKK